MHFISAFLFGISANIDAFALGLSYGIKKQYISLPANILISFITFAGTLLSIGIGLKIAVFVPQEVSKIIGSLLLILLGLYYCVKYLLIYLKEVGTTADSLSVQSDSALTLKETFVLGITLSLNNTGMGIGASFAGIHFLLTSLITLLLSSVFLMAGNRIGSRLFPEFLQNSADLFSGVIIMALGIYELIL